MRKREKKERRKERKKTQGCPKLLKLSSPMISNIDPTSGLKRENQLTEVERLAKTRSSRSGLLLSQGRLASVNQSHCLFIAFCIAQVEVWVSTEKLKKEMNKYK